MRSNKYKALSQMLLTNQHLDKLAAAMVDFEQHGMLKSSTASSHFQYLCMIFPSHSVSGIRLITFIGGRGVDPTSIPQDLDLDTDADGTIVDERLDIVHSAIKLAHIPGTSSRS